MRRAALALAAALALPAAAHAQTYARAGLGYEHGRESGFRFGGAEGRFEGTAAVDAGVGRRVAPFIRVEALASWRPRLAFEAAPPGASGRASSAAALAVGYFDFGGLGRARPFLGLGYGAARNRFEGVPATEPAWLLAAGLGWSLSDRTTLDLAARYVDLGGVRTAADTRAKLVTTGVNASLRRRF
jgi:opacity protein-like surface antigen